MKKSLKRNKKMRKNKSHRARHLRKRGGMFSRLATNVASRIDPHAQKKVQQFGLDIIEATAKTSDSYKNYENTVNTAGKDLSYKISNVYNQTMKPTNVNMYPNIPQTFPIFKEVASSNYYKSINHPLTNI